MRSLHVGPILGYDRLMSIACLPWYALPETQSAQDALWSVLAGHLRRRGVADAPASLTRDPPVPGVLTDPRLLIGQCCGYDVVYGFAASVVSVATPCYAADGCGGPTYRSFVLVREDSPATDLAGLRGGICAINSFNSHSGTSALRGLIAPLSREGRFFSGVRVSGSHLNSLALLLAGKADVMAMDCVLYALLMRHRPAALAGTRVIGRTAPAPAPPFITSAVNADRAALMGEALTAAVADAASRDACGAMLLDDVVALPLAAYAAIVEAEAVALGHGYLELHATSPALLPAEAADRAHD